VISFPGFILQYQRLVIRSMPKAVGIMKFPSVVHTVRGGESARILLMKEPMAKTKVPIVEKGLQTTLHI
jgi:hypothetical protein